jgi:hypothetical protein
MWTLLRTCRHSLAFVLLATPTLMSQSPVARSVVRGTVTDSARRPVERATVRLSQDDVVVTTDGEGRFRFDGLRGGAYVLHVQKLGYVPRRWNISVATDDTVAGTFVLEHSPTTLDTVRVDEAAPNYPVGGHLAAFEEHRKGGQGIYLTPQDIVKYEDQMTLSDLLKHKTSGMRFIGGRGTSVYLASRMSTMNSADAPRPRSQRDLPAACYSSVFIDGVLTYRAGTDGPRTNLNDFPLAQIAAVELYRGSATTPGQYQSVAVCGVLLIWTRDGTPMPKKD